MRLCGRSAAGRGTVCVCVCIDLRASTSKQRSPLSYLSGLSHHVRANWTDCISTRDTLCAVASAQETYYVRLHQHERHTMCCSRCQQEASQQYVTTFAMPAMQVQQAVLPCNQANAFCTEDELAAVAELSFLSSWVQHQVKHLFSSYTAGA